MALILNGKPLSRPILQGAMSVGVSLSSLAGAVAACGGMGTIAASACGFMDPAFPQDARGTSLRALFKHVHRAREISRGQGIVAVNVIATSTHYADSVRIALQAGADAIVAGGGVPGDLPAIAAQIPDQNAALAPMVSSGRAADLICRLWDRRYQYIPDFVVLEGPMAGGHLGFLRDALADPPSLSSLLQEVLAALAPYREKAGRDIPVFVAGGIRDGAEMARYMKEGAAGAQFATRFIATEECDASDTFKRAVIAAGNRDLTIINTPAGTPGRVLRSPLIRRLEESTQARPSGCVQCMTVCDPYNVPFCMLEAMIAAVQGDWENGLFFCGGAVADIREMSTVPQQFAQLISQW